MRYKTRQSTILIVDDVAKNIQVVAGFLKPENYKLAFAQSGAAALEQVQKYNIDLILLDVMMPEMDGFEVCERLKANPATSLIPIIFLTGRTESESIVQGLNIGAVDYITKPFQREELLARVRNHLELKHAQEQINALYGEIQRDLNLAAGVQSTVMRAKCKVDFVRSFLDFKPYNLVSGDIVDFLNKPDEMRLFLGDATGHGISAALVTMMVPYILDQHQPDGGILETIAHINDALAERDSESYITGVYITLQRDGTLHCCMAGHPPIFLLPAQSHQIISLKAQGAPLGMFHTDAYSTFETETHRLKTGDKLVIYTDGLYERFNDEIKPFGIKRMQHQLNEDRHLNLEAMAANLIHRIEAFAADTPSDDSTLILLEYTG